MPSSPKTGSSQQKYDFILDDGEIIWVDFETMMSMDGGFIEINGKLARRVNRPSEKKSEPVKNTKDPEIVSDALGFPAQQLQDFEADRMSHGFRSVEFRPDPQVPEFMRVHFNNRDEYKRYVKHRGMFDKNSLNGSSATLSEGLLSKLESKVREVHGG